MSDNDDTYVVRVWSFDGDKQTFEGIYGPYSETEALEVEEQIRLMPRWDRHSAIAEAIKPWPSD